MEEREEGRREGGGLLFSFAFKYGYAADRVETGGVLVR
jgi:hypothetical protein